ncbi:hypothetical protein P171DRAFT_483103 [Karstenula rhodostoma CBS 690.94]|uniref:Uncharacterized protein n=1 Tax=Karstenula rhodostoma CBS 690.94 TaxID=1392251 RepID=A0A9P4PN73_9PLEO|nr:hypothetical protein P171DRAFT_483103 [Karstenula rhodostoma CBS 690.94]
MSTSFERPSAASSRQNSTSSTSSTLSKTWKKIKEHHDGMNDAFATYYGGGRRSHEAWNPSPRGSVTFEESEHEPLVEKKGLAKKMLGRVKEHHRSVNAAYRTYYGS